MIRQLANTNSPLRDIKNLINYIYYILKPKINRWNSIADTNVGNYDKVVVLLG